MSGIGIQEDGCGKDAEVEVSGTSEDLPVLHPGDDGAGERVAARFRCGRGGVGIERPRARKESSVPTDAPVRRTQRGRSRRRRVEKAHERGEEWADGWAVHRERGEVRYSTRGRADVH